MKKLLFGILTFLGIGLSFCSADGINGSITCNPEEWCNVEMSSCLFESIDLTFTGNYNNFVLYPYSDGVNIYAEVPVSVGNTYSFYSEWGFCGFFVYNNNSFTIDVYYSEPVVLPSIDVYYNNGNSVENITCDGTQAIQINGLSTITSTNTFTPYYNISYTDEDNQKLTESYSKDILYLENGQFKKTYTGNNERILTVQGNDSENSFSGYLPTFEVTGGIEEVTDSGNIFNNFAENSVKFAFSNIPSYIQYVLMFALLMLILGLVKPFKRGR